MARKQKKFASNYMIACLLGLTIVISLVGTAIVHYSGPSVPQDVTVSSAKVTVNVAQSPARPTGQVTLFVLPKIGMAR